MLFLKVAGYVEERVLKLFVKIEEGVNPIMPILAETFRSLNHCRTKKAGKFIGCAPLLYIWIVSHVECPPEFNIPKMKFTNSWNMMQNPILEFTRTNVGQILPEKKVWVDFFSTLKPENV